MGYVSVDPLFSGRDGTPFSSTGERSYTKKWRVVVDDKNMGPIQVTFAPGIALPWTPYVSNNGVEYDLLALLTKLSAAPEHEDDWQNWIVTGNYTTNHKGKPDNTNSPANSSGSQNNPEEEKPEIDWDYEVLNVPMDVDLDEKPLMNSAQVPISPIPTREKAIPVLTYTRNELFFGAENILDWAFTINSDIFLGNPPGRVQCMPPKAKQMFKGGLTYWKVTYKLRFKDTEWDPIKILDAGLSELAPARGVAQALIVNANGANQNVFLQTPVPIYRGGTPITSPVLLDGNGKQLLPDGKGKIVPVYNKFRSMRRREFASLLLRGL